MEYLNLTPNSSNLRTLCAVGFNKIIKMMRFLGFMLLFISGSRSQLPYGSTPGPFTPSVPTGVDPTFSPKIPPVGPNGFPFGPNTRPFQPGYNNPYYNPSVAPAIPILTYTSDHVGDGTYSFSYSTADGKQAQESGYLKDAYIDNAGEPQGTQVVQGSYAYVAPDGTPIQVNYIADENGFRPSGIHIPADGKALPPLPPPVIDGRKDKIVDPFNRFDPYNRIDPYNYRNRYNYNGQFNRGYPNDPRYPYNPARYNPLNPINPINPFNAVPLYGNRLNNKDEPKKTSA